MSTPTPELRDEIAQHLRANSDTRHGMIFRDMELGLDAEQIALSQRTTLDNARGYIRGIEAMLSGRLPTAPSIALKASNPYRYLLGCPLSPALRNNVTSCLHQLAAINPEIRVEEPFRPGTLHDAGTLAREAAATQKTACPTCHMVHAGECLYGESLQ